MDSDDFSGTNISNKYFFLYLFGKYIYHCILLHIAPTKFSKMFGLSKVLYTLTVLGVICPSFINPPYQPFKGGQQATRWPPCWPHFNTSVGKCCRCWIGFDFVHGFT